MTFIRRDSNRKLVLCRRPKAGKGTARNVNNYRDWWLVKYSIGKSNPEIKLMGVTFPKSLIGKRVRFIVEIVK